MPSSNQDRGSTPHLMQLTTQRSWQGRGQSQQTTAKSAVCFWRPLCSLRGVQVGSAEQSNSAHACTQTALNTGVAGQHEERSSPCGCV